MQFTTNTGRVQGFGCVANGQNQCSSSTSSTSSPPAGHPNAIVGEYTEGLSTRMPAYICFMPLLHCFPWLAFNSNNLLPAAICLSSGAFFGQALRTTSGWVINYLGFVWADNQ